MQLPRLDDPPASSSNGSVLGMILGGICTVVVVIFKILWVLCQIVIAVMGWCLLMDWLSGRDDR
ncbi:MAG: hypothetical protein MJ025_05630 [Victivallaceae bacterium]|nr:hypothetical protein [Victivallaceae bacterium]